MEAPVCVCRASGAATPAILPRLCSSSPWTGTLELLSHLCSLEDTKALCVRCHTTCGSVPDPSLQSRQTDGGRGGLSNYFTNEKLKPMKMKPFDKGCVGEQGQSLVLNANITPCLVF